MAQACLKRTYNPSNFAAIRSLMADVRACARPVKINLISVRVKVHS
jgi:hypothetical protein